MVRAAVELAQAMVQLPTRSVAEQRRKAEVNMDLLNQLRQAHIRVLLVGLVVAGCFGFLLGLTIADLVWR